jgi:phenylalanyl-tRNA synthetase beta chain
MKIPLSWLKDYVDITVPVEDLAERLTLAGLEVETIEYIGLAPQRKSVAQSGLAWDREKIVVGAVLEVKPHPNADRLVLADVDYGASEPHTVVTGAPNLFEYKGQGRLARPLKVAYAKTGATLYDGHQPGQVLATLKPTKIRGVPSDAMVCSEKELGISDEHEGILFFPDDAPVGMPLADYMGDAILGLDIKGSFGHLQNVTGIAREAAALLGTRMNRDVLTILDRAPVQVIEQSDFIELEIADPDLCPRYSAALIRGVKIGPSPFWMQQRLARAGMRPINNIVDITNYVMLELGQPLHAFDYHKLSPRATGGVGGGRPAIIVRRAREGETMTTLDNQLRQLDTEMLLITDGGGPVAIGGVMGGLESEVTEATTDILLEAANFDFLNNRRTSQMLGLKSEASIRFGKRIDPELTLKTLARAGQLMEQLAGGKVEPVYGDLYPGKREPVVITLDPAYVNRLLGIEIPVEEMVRILMSLEFNVTLDASHSPLHVVVPSHRLDVSLPADLAEEIARVYGYDRFPSTVLRDELPPQRDNPRLEGADRVRDVLAGCGLDEIITYSMTTEAREALLLPPGALRDERPYLHVINPIAADKVALRHTLLASALDTLAANLRFGDRMTMFEIGAVYLPHEGQLLPDEPRHLSIAMTGPRQDENWQPANRAPMDFWDIKGVVQVLVERLRLNDVRYEPSDHPTYHTGRAAKLSVGEKEIGTFGELHPLVRLAFDLPQQPVCAAEFDLDALLDMSLGAYAYQAVSRFPAVREDIAVVVDEAITAAQVEATIWNAGGSLRVLRDVRLFDLYRGEQVSAGRKSLAYRLVYQADDRTLTDDDATKIRAKIIKALERELSATLRA